MNPLLSAVSNAELSDDPFTHVRIDRFLSDGWLTAELMRTFPVELPLSRSKVSGQKSYAMHARTAQKGAARTEFGSSMPGCWRQLFGWLTDPDYALAVLRRLGRDEVDVEIELRLTEYRPGDWLSRHTDRPEKVFSQIIYLCEEWQESWGGELALYSSRHAARARRVVVPGPANSILFARSPSSWHEVRPVSATSRRPRRALLVHAYHSGLLP
jgi:SM-20-related protein